MNQNETIYRKTVGAIGLSMLFFLLFLNLTGLVYAFLPSLLETFGCSSVLTETVNELVYSFLYLFSFMTPVWILRGLLKGRNFAPEAMNCSFKLTPYLPFLVFAMLAFVWTSGYINDYFVSLFDFSLFSIDTEIVDFNLEVSENYQIVLRVIEICVVPGFCEEYLFRGAILSNCRRFGRGKAILISALLFSLMHQNPSQFFYAFVAGLFLGIVYEKTGSIWNCILLHTLNNFMAVFESVIQTRCTEEFVNLFMPLFDTAVFCLGILSILFLVVRFNEKKPNFDNGIFGKTFALTDSYAEYPVEGSRSVKLFFTPSMIIFFCFVAVEAVFLLAV